MVVYEFESNAENAEPAETIILPLTQRSQRPLRAHGLCEQ